MVKHAPKLFTPEDASLKKRFLGAIRDKNVGLSINVRGPEDLWR
jgi:hypothetical protein